MSGTVNKVVLIGRLGKDPEVKYTSGGTPVCKFSIATEDQWKDGDGNQRKRTEWHSIEAWQRLAEICGEYLHKGSLVYIDGSLKTDTWGGPNGVRMSKTKVVCREMKMLGSKPKTEGAGPAGAPQTPAQTPAPSDAEISDEDIPF
jgi:single-strand DNA-binding protein